MPPCRSSVDIDQLVFHECTIIGKGGAFWPQPTYKVCKIKLCFPFPPVNACHRMHPFCVAAHNHSCLYMSSELPGKFSHCGIAASRAIFDHAKLAHCACLTSISAALRAECMLCCMCRSRVMPSALPDSACRAYVFAREVGALHAAAVVICIPSCCCRLWPWTGPMSPLLANPVPAAGPRCAWLSAHLPDCTRSPCLPAHLFRLHPQSLLRSCPVTGLTTTSTCPAPQCCREYDSVPCLACYLET